MKKSITDFINGALYSFTNDKKGFSARKLTAFALMLCVGYMHVRYVDKTNVIDALLIDLSAILLLLGIITVQQLIELKLGKRNETQSNESVSG